MSEPHEDVLIVGGGAGGAELAVRLARAGCANVRLIDQATTHVWKPRLHELAAGAVRGELGELSYQDLAERWGFTYEQASLADVNPEQRTVMLEPATGGTARAHGYRLLVLAVGGVTPDLGVKGMAEHTVALDRSPDAETLHRRFIEALNRRAEATDMTPARVVIVGTGLTGVELAGYLASNKRAIAEAGGAKPQNLDIRLLEASDTFMPAIDDAPTQRGARTRLESLGVTIHTGQAVSEVDANGLTTESGARYDADLVVWATGRVGPPVAGQTERLAANDKQQWLIRETLQSRDHDDIFAIGDCSSCPSQSWPATAQVASQQAEHLGEQIMAWLDGDTPGAFTFNNKGLLMSFGDGGDLGLLVTPFSETLRIHGHASHAAYRGLERQHQWVLLGTRRTVEGAAGDFFDAFRNAR